MATAVDAAAMGEVLRQHAVSMAEQRARYISPISPLYLPYISPVSP